MINVTLDKLRDKDQDMEIKKYNTIYVFSIRMTLYFETITNIGVSARPSGSEPYDVIGR